MSTPQSIVNKLLENELGPEHYLSWLGQKADFGNLDDIRFGAHIHTTEWDVLEQNAKESGIDVDSPEVKDQLERDYSLMEATGLAILRSAGLNVSDEGHGSDNERVASVWIMPEDPYTRTAIPVADQIALAKKIVESEGDAPSTSNGTLWTFFPDSETTVYNNISDIGRQLIDMTIEFTGTDDLAEWLKLNIVENADDADAPPPRSDPDDPEAFIRSFVPRMLGRVLIEFNVIKPHFPDAPRNWIRENVDGIELFRFNRVGEMREVMRQMKAYNQERGERAGIDQVTYRYRVPNPKDSSIVRRWLDKIACPVPLQQWVCETNAPIWFYTRVKEFNAFMQMVYPQVKLDPVVENEADDPERYIQQIHVLDDILQDLTNYGLAHNRIEPWGKWVVVNGFAYWAVDRNDQPLSPGFFREQLEKFCAAHSITVHKIQIEGGEGSSIYFKLAIPKSQLDKESYAWYSRYHEDPDFPERGEDLDAEHREWLVKEGVDDPDNVDPMAYAVSTVDVNALLPRLGYRKEGDGWHKIMHREPSRTDIMIEVTRRGLGMDPEYANVLYDVTLYTADIKHWRPFLYRYGRTVDKLEPLLKRLETGIKTDWVQGERPVNEADEPDPDASIDPRHYLDKVTGWKDKLLALGFAPDRTRPSDYNRTFETDDRAYHVYIGTNQRSLTVEREYLDGGPRQRLFFHKPERYLFQFPNNDALIAFAEAICKRLDEWRKDEHELKDVLISISLHHLFDKHQGRKAKRVGEAVEDDADASIDPKEYLLSTPKDIKDYESVRSRAEADQKALANYEAHKGKFLKVPYVMGMDEHDDTKEVWGDIIVRVLDTSTEDILRYHTGDSNVSLYLDPVWNVEVTSGPPELDGTRSHYIDATSYKIPLIPDDDRLQRLHLEAATPAVPVPEPDPDDPEDVLRQHGKGIIVPELNRLGFTARRERGVETLYSEQDVPRYWYKAYAAPDGNTHGVCIYFFGGQDVEVRANVYNYVAKAWLSDEQKAPPTMHAQSYASIAGFIRDMDKVMEQNAAISLPPEQERESIQQIATQYSRWYWDAINAWPVLRMDPHVDAQGNLPGRIGPGRPA